VDRVRRGRRARGAGLIDPQGRFNIALRDRVACASQPSHDGFDVVAFLPTSRSVLEDLAARCDRLGIAHSGINETGARFGAHQRDVPPVSNRDSPWL
jgi:hypothetical protein